MKKKRKYKLIMWHQSKENQPVKTEKSVLCRSDKEAIEEFRVVYHGDKTILEGSLVDIKTGAEIYGSTGYC